MTSNLCVKIALAEFEENELIFASKLYREKLSLHISEVAYYKTLQRMCDSKELVNIAKGIYHLPKRGKYGVVPISEKEIITAFTKNETGTVIGYSLYNALDITTQISKNVIVLSSSVEGSTKTVKNVIVHHVPLKFSEKLATIIRGLEILQNFNTIQDINYSAFLKYTKKLAASFDEDIFKEIITTKTYKKSTIAFMREILNYYQVINNLNEYLSSLSEYKHPKMKELHELLDY